MIKSLSRLCAAFFLSAILVAPAFAQITDRLNGVSTSLAIKAPVRAISSGALTLRGEQTVNGVVVVAGDRVLVKDQADSKTNGIYVVAASNWSRAADFDDNRDVAQGTLVIAYNNIANGVLYQVTTANPVIIGTSTITFALRDTPTVQYPQTQTEIDSGVTPTNYAYVEGHVYRYGTNTTPGTTDMAAAINAAINVESHHSNGGEVHIPAGILRIASTINAAANVSLVGEGGQSSAIYADNTDAITIGYQTYYGGARISGLYLYAVSGGSTHTGINAPGTADHNYQTYGVAIENNFIRGFNVGIHARTLWYSSIHRNRIEDCDRGIEMLGQNIANDIAFNNVLKSSAPGGAGSSVGMTFGEFNYTTSGGILPTESVRLLSNQIFGFQTAINLASVHFATLTDNDIEASVVGIDFTSVDLILNIKGGFVEIDGAAGDAGVYGRSLGSGTLATKVNITGVGFSALGTSTAVGVRINSPVGQDQNFVTVADSEFDGFNTNDIQFNNAGTGWITRNRCKSSAPTYSIVATGVLSGTVFITQNLCTKDISTTAADESAGKVVREDNIINASTRENFKGIWTTPTYAGGNFTGNGSMTWTVDSGDVITYEYTILNKTMTVKFYIGATTVAGTPSTQLRMAIPASKVATKASANACYLIDNGARTTGLCTVSASGTTINAIRTDAANFTAATNATDVYGELTFEIN